MQTGKILVNSQLAMQPSGTHFTGSLVLRNDGFRTPYLILTSKEISEATKRQPFSILENGEEEAVTLSISSKAFCMIIRIFHSSTVPLPFISAILAVLLVLFVTPRI